MKIVNSIMPMSDIGAPAANGQNTGSATQESPADSGQTDSKKEIGPGIK